MEKETVMKAGYTLVVDSWENDGDEYQTHSMHFKQEDDAVTVFKMMRDLFKGIGNTDEDDNAFVNKQIDEYIAANIDELKNVIPGLDGTTIEQQRIAISHYATNLLGYTEFYLFRVVDSLKILFTPVDCEVMVLKKDHGS